MYNDITGIILSGGSSTRMGVNKSLLKIGSKTVIEHVLVLMESIFTNVILSTNNPEDYSFLGTQMFKDVYPHSGPLAGIHSGLVNSSRQKNFILSCDMPLMTKEMIDYIIQFKTDKPVTVAKSEGYIQQLCGLYDKSCAGFAEEILINEADNELRETEQKKRGCRVLRLIDVVGAEIIDAESLSFYSPDLFFNMNKREDYEYALKKLSSKTSV